LAYQPRGDARDYRPGRVLGGRERTVDDVVPERAARTERRRRHLTVPPALVEAGALTAATVAVLVVGLKLWRATWDVPFVYGTEPGTPEVYAGDAPFYLMVVQSLIVHGSYLANPSLGAPFGSELHDLPHGTDNLHLLLLGLIGKATGSAAGTVNLYYLLTFVLVALAAHFTLRRLGLRPATAGALALVYAFLPYHFARGTSHLLLSGYFLVPVAVLLVLSVASGDPPFVRRDDRGRTRIAWRERRTWLWLLACAGLASTGPYYAWFTVFFLAVAGLAELLAGRGRQALLSAAVAVVAIIVVALANLSPSIVFWLRHGDNPNVASRSAHETEVDGLKISQLVLPFDGHRIPVLRDLHERAVRDTPVRSENGQQLGVVGAVGFAGLLVLGVVGLVRPGRARVGATWRPTPVGTVPDVLARLSMLTIVGCLTAAVSGFSLLIASLGARQIRSWNRITVFLAFFALLAVGLALDRWFDHLTDRRAARRAAPRVAPPVASRADRPVAARPRAGRAPAGALPLAVLAALVAVALLDQVTPAVVPAYDAAEARWESDGAFAEAVAEVLPAGAMVFSLPYVRFPEAGTQFGAGPYDESRGFVHLGDRLRWSFGDTVGRHGTWQKRVGNFPAPTLVAEVAALGFHGIEVDTAGYGDGGGLIRLALTDALAREPDVVSPDGRLLFYDLRPYAAAQQAQLPPEQIEALRRDALTPVPARDDRPVPPPPPEDRVPQPRL
jgi:phosphoglycerol transferase